MEKTKMKTSGIAKFIEEAKSYRDDPTVLNKIIEAMSEKIDELQSKADAYDRLMKGGKKTLKEIANFLGRAVVVDDIGNAESFAGEPRIDIRYGFWYLDEDDEDYEDDRFLIPSDIVDFNGDWRGSLTLPDGWEEK